MYKYKGREREYMYDWHLKNKCIYKEKNKTYRKDAYKRATLIMKDLKINGCAICGYDKCSASLSFHHVNSEDKKFNININQLRYAEERIINELTKCILLCANCHREIHYKERRYEYGKSKIYIGLCE